MLGRGPAQKPAAVAEPVKAPPPPVTLLTVVGEIAKIEGKFEIADSLHVECAIGGELTVGGKLVIGEKGVVNANVQTVDALIQGVYEGNMVATGDVEITQTGRVSGNIETDSLVIAKGGSFTGNVTHKNGANGRPVYLVDDKRASVAHPIGTPR